MYTESLTANKLCISKYKCCFLKSDWKMSEIVFGENIHLESQLKAVRVDSKTNWVWKVKLQKSNKLNVLVHYEYLIQVNQIFNIIHMSSMRSVCMHILVLPVLPSNDASKFLKIYLLNFHFSKVIDHRTWAFWENCLINHMMSKYMTLYIPPISLYLIGEFYILRCSLEISTLTLSIRTPWILSLQNSSALFLRDGMEASDSAGNWLVVKVIKFEFTS